MERAHQLGDLPELRWPVAVGWRLRPGQRTPGRWEEPAEADCINGCPLTSESLRLFAIPWARVR